MTFTNYQKILIAKFLSCKIVKRNNMWRVQFVSTFYILYRYFLYLCNAYVYVHIRSVLRRRQKSGPVHYYLILLEYIDFCTCLSGTPTYFKYYFLFIMRINHYVTISIHYSVCRYYIFTFMYLYISVFFCIYYWNFTYLYFCLYLYMYISLYSMFSVHFCT